MEALGRVVLHALALALGQPTDHFDACVTPRPEVLVKLIRYPAATAAETQGVGEHRDTGLLTFVHQDDIAGLQVQLGGTFVDVPRVDGAFVVNLGEMMQLLTHGYFAATVHRVVSPPPGTERVSAAYFFNPKLEATLEPLTLSPELAADAPGGASADPTNPILANYGENSLKVRLPRPPRRRAAPPRRPARRDLGLRAAVVAASAGRQNGEPRGRKLAAPSSRVSAGERGLVRGIGRGWRRIDVGYR